MDIYPEYLTWSKIYRRLIYRQDTSSTETHSEYKKRHADLKTSPVRRPRTLVHIWTFIRCLQTLLNPASLNARTGTTLRRVALSLQIKMTNFKSTNPWCIFNQILQHWHSFVLSNFPSMHTSWITVVTPTDRPKSVRNRCVIDDFGGVFVLSIGFWIFCW